MVHVSRSKILCKVHRYCFQFFETEVQGYKLVIAGSRDTHFLDLEKIIARENLRKYVTLTGFVTQEEKVALYRGASVFIFPSLYEGFGLPVLEAQTMGIPVLTSNTSASPEVAGNGALY